MIGLSLLNIAVIGLIAASIAFSAFLALFMGQLVLLAVIVEIIIGALLSWLFFGAIGNQAAAVVYGLPTRLGQSFSSTWKNTGKAIGLAFRIFIYSGAWMIFIVLLLYPIVNTVLGAGAEYQYMSVLHADPVLLAQGFISNDTPGRIMELPYQQGPSLRGTVLTIINFALALAGLITIIIATIRSVRTTMAFPTLLAHPEMSAKEALEHSKEITKKRWWLTFSYLTVFSFILTGIPLLLNLAAAFEPLAFLKGLTGIITLVLGVISLPLMACFLQVFSFELGNPLKTVRLHWMMIILAILSILAPPAVSFATAYMNAASMVKNFSSGKQSYIDTLTGMPDIKTSKPDINSLIKASEKIPTDADRIVNLAKWIPAIEKFKEEKGYYPSENTCIGTSFEPEDYYDGDAYEISHDTQTISAAFGRTAIFNCSQVYQYLGMDSYALYATLDDTKKNNLDTPFKTLEEAKGFKPSSGGKFYVIFKDHSGEMLKVNAVTAAKEITSKNDDKRLTILSSMSRAIQNYRNDKGEYPPISGCTDMDLKEELTPYFPDKTMPKDPTGFTISGMDDGKAFSGCHMYYQNLGSDHYALYMSFEDPSRNDVEKIFKDYEETKSFIPKSGGKYYVIIVGGPTTKLPPTPAFNTPADVSLPTPLM